MQPNYLFAAIVQWFEENSEWRWAATIGRSGIVRIVGAIPFLGYAILWSNEAHDWLMNFEALGGSDWFSVQGRLYQLWWGALITLITYCAYLLACPAPVRTHNSEANYVTSVLESGDLREVGAAYRAVSSRFFALPTPPNGFEFLGFPVVVVAEALNQFKDDNGRYYGIFDPSHRIRLAMMLSMHYRALSRSNPLAMMLIVVGYLTGLTLFFTPAAEVAARVVVSSVSLVRFTEGPPP